MVTFEKHEAFIMAAFCGKENKTSSHAKTLSLSMITES
jgi:hypothetical protein